jgi:hypothetical protein
VAKQHGNKGADMTQNVPATTTETEKPAPPKRITKKIRAAVDALVHGDAKSITEAAEKAGLPGRICPANSANRTSPPICATRCSAT